VHSYSGAETKLSRADIEVTKDIKKALAMMGIALHDHLIVAGTSCASVKNLGHPYNLSLIAAKLCLAIV
jgi:DNA repair protein RadC